jgi:hypothetical protein
VVRRLRIIVWVIAVLSALPWSSAADDRKLQEAEFELGGLFFRQRVDPEKGDFERRAVSLHIAHQESKKLIQLYSVNHHVFFEEVRRFRKFLSAEGAAPGSVGGFDYSMIGEARVRLKVSPPEGGGRRVSVAISKGEALELLKFLESFSE